MIAHESSHRADKKLKWILCNSSSKKEKTLGLHKSLHLEENERVDKKKQV